jgi:hypothetical protein
MIASLGQDLRYAPAQLRKSPGFTAVGIHSSAGDRCEYRNLQPPGKV